MKTLTVLVIAQLALLVLLLVKVVSIDNASPGTMAEQPPRMAAPHAVPVSGSQVRGAPFPEDRLREIIREELAALPLPANQADGADTYRSMDPAEIEYQREQVAQQLEYHVSVGTISEVDMARLQMQIAKLDAAGRKEMLGELTRAMNSGRLEGRL